MTLKAMDIVTVKNKLQIVIPGHVRDEAIAALDAHAKTLRRTPDMKLRFTERAGKDYAGMPVAIRKAFRQTTALLAGQSQASPLHSRSPGNDAGSMISRVAARWST